MDPGCPLELTLLDVELTGFYIPTRSTSSSVSSNGQPGSIDLLPAVLRRHAWHQENITEISYWPVYRGSAQATLSNNLGGGELNATWTMPPQDAWRIDLLGGFRFLQLRESYTINTSSPYNPPNPADIWNTTDSSTRATASTACSSACVPRTTRARGSAA